jgi:hypothetical protein
MLMKRLQSLKGHWGMTFIVIALVGYFSILGFSQTPDIDDDGDVIQSSIVFKTKLSAPKLLALTPHSPEFPTSSNPFFELTSQRVDEPNFLSPFFSPNFRGPPAFSA